MIGRMTSPVSVVEVPLTWLLEPAPPLLRATNVLLQVSPGPDGNPEDVVITFGEAQIPVFTGPPSEQALQAQALTAIGVRSVCRLSLSPARLAELRTAVDQMLKALEDARRTNDVDEGAPNP